GVEVLTPRFFNEFAVKLPRNAAEVVDQLAERGVLAGVPYGRLNPGAGPRNEGWDDVLLIAATETTTDDDIQSLKTALAEVL
ncbi:MAG: glycine dehydrogenase, partial [Brevundimonas sp.]